jgi:serine/threonine protein kinase
MLMACGTLSYIAPEVIMCRGYTSAVDIWGLGIVCFLLLMGRLPFGGKDKDKVIDNILSAPVKFGSRVNLSPEAKDFVTRMLEKDPAERMTLELAMKHPWIALASKPEARALEPQSPFLGFLLSAFGLHSPFFQLPEATHRWCLQFCRSAAFKATGSVYGGNHPRGVCNTNHPQAAYTSMDAFTAHLVVCLLKDSRFPTLFLNLG